MLVDASSIVVMVGKLIAGKVIVMTLKNFKKIISSFGDSTLITLSICVLLINATQSIHAAIIIEIGLSFVHTARLAPANIPITNKLTHHFSDSQKLFPQRNFVTFKICLRSKHFGNFHFPTSFYDRTLKPKRDLRGKLVEISCILDWKSFFYESDTTTQVKITISKDMLLAQPWWEMRFSETVVKDNEFPVVTLSKI